MASSSNPTSQVPFPPSNVTLPAPITSLWNGNDVNAAKIAKECLSCDRWAGTTVIGGGAYLLYNMRRAPNPATKLTMLAIGSIMVAAGSYQGWINPYISV